MATLRLLWTSFRSKLANRIPQSALQMLGVHFAKPGLSIEPLQRFMTQISATGDIPDPFTDWQEKFRAETAIIASRPNRATQAAECRVKILDTLEKVRLWKYILSIEDRTLRDTVLRHMFLENSLSERQRARLMIWKYAYSLLSDLAFTGIYENQFSKELSLDAFTTPYEAMADFSARVLVKRVIADETVRNDQITDLDAADKMLLAIRCRDVFSNKLISDLSEIRKQFRNAIAEGFVDNLYVFQKKFADKMIEIESLWSAEVNHLTRNQSLETGSALTIQHAWQNDSSPATWKPNSQQPETSTSSYKKEFVTIANGLATMDSLDKELFESGDNKLEFYRKSEGSLMANEEHQEILDSTEGTLPWSSNPGAYEAHLMRRHHNPYFPAARRSVSHEDLEKAKKKDRDDYILCQRCLEELSQEIDALPQTVTSGDLMALRKRLDDLIFFSMGVGGPATEIASEADQLREAVISDLRSNFSGDEETLSMIEKADIYHKDNVRRFYIPVLAQILRENSPILEGERIPAILSEDPSAIAIFVNSLSEDGRALVQIEGLKLLREALSNGHLDAQCEEKIFALKGEWPISRPRTGAQ